MRKIILLVALFSSICMMSQDYPGKRPELLLNKEVKLKPLNERMIAGYGGYTEFYSDEHMMFVYKKNSRLVTNPEAFTNRTFKVSGVEPVTGIERYRIKLADTATGEVIYYQYNPTTTSDYYLEVTGGLDFPDDFYCDLVKEITRDKDVQRLVYMERSAFTLLKTKKDKLETYLLEFELNRDENETGKGLVLVLENNKKIEKPDAEVKMEVKSTTPHYSTSVTLTPQDVELLKNNAIVSYKIYKFSENMYKPFAINIKGALNCMLTKK